MTRFDLDTFRLEVQRRIKAEGLNSLSRRVDVPISRLRSVAAGRDMQASTLMQLCKGFNIELHFDQFGWEPVEAAKIEDSDYAEIGVAAAIASAGPGIINEEQQHVGGLAFRRDWLKRLGVNPARASILRVQGASMAPTIPEDSIVLVDHQQCEPTDNNVFALVRDEELLIKRLSRISDTAIALISDNPNHLPQVISGPDLNALRIIGRAVWSGRELGMNWASTAQ